MSFTIDTKILVLPECWDDNAMEQIGIPNLISIAELEKLKHQKEINYKQTKNQSQKLELINLNRLILSIRKAYYIS